jgi:hypothetical protein
MTSTTDSISISLLEESKTPINAIGTPSLKATNGTAASVPDAIQESSLQTAQRNHASNDASSTHAIDETDIEASSLPTAEPKDFSEAAHSVNVQEPDESSVASVTREKVDPQSNSLLDGFPSPASSKATLPPPPPLESPKSPLRALGTRPSPWREPRAGTLPPPARDASQEKRPASPRRDPRRTERRRARRCAAYASSGAMAVRIPLHVTADLGVALRRGRAHRIAALVRQFPQLAAPEEPAVPERGSPPKPVAAKPVLRHVPQPHEYANVIDYLEAKYVQGVVISDDMEEGGSAVDAEGPEDDEGQGSVYSETSFVDDTGLQRTIAEQVLGHTTTTKLELMNTNEDDEDAAFFVNVGDLEIEETELTQDMYDPLDDTRQDSKSKKTRKRKKSAAESATSNAASTVQEPPNKKEKSSKASSSTTTKPATAPKKMEENYVGSKEVKNSKANKTSPVKPEPVSSKDLAVLKLQKVSGTKRAEVDRLLHCIEESIKAFTEEELPLKPKPKRTRVVVKVPRDNKPGDMITFANPHIPGQKLKVKVPVNTKPGDTFKVTVPKPPEEEEEQLGDDGVAKDHNKFSREFYDELDAYARAYDDWCDAEGAYRKAIRDNTFSPHFMKRNKCDDIVPLFPTGTKTPITVEYLKKVIRRARQNKHKRELTLARQQQQSFVDDGNEGDANNSDDGSGSDENAENGNNNVSSDDEEEEEKSPSSPIQHDSPKQLSKKAKPTRTAMLPLMSRTFPAKTFNVQDFMEAA